VTMCQTQLGNQEEARQALDRALALAPTFAKDPRGAYRLHRVPESLIDQFMDGLRKAGLEFLPLLSTEVGFVGRSHDAAHSEARAVTTLGRLRNPAYTTVRNGDILLPLKRKMFAGCHTLMGLLMVGWSTLLGLSHHQYLEADEVSGRLPGSSAPRPAQQ
jgi:hypothetical protein